MCQHLNSFRIHPGQLGSFISHSRYQFVSNKARWGVLYTYVQVAMDWFSWIFGWLLRSECHKFAAFLSEQNGSQEQEGIGACKGDGGGGEEGEAFEVDRSKEETTTA